MRNIYLLLVSILFCSSILAQEITVKGRVISQEEPDGIPGVAIMVKGTTTGTVTDVDGNYSIKANAKAVLQFSSIGYTPYEVVVGDRGIINVELQTSVEQLEEVVVVGYGEQKKASIVGTVSNMKNDDLKRAAPSNLTAAIGGRVTGALVRLGDGNVGGADARYSSGELDNAQIFIRGKATTNTATPLILVDGVESSFSRINR